MDVNTVRAVLTVVCFAVFIGIVAWAYSGGRRERFNEAARVPLLDDGSVSKVGAFFTSHGPSGPDGVAVD